MSGIASSGHRNGPRAGSRFPERLERRVHPIVSLLLATATVALAPTPLVRSAEAGHPAETTPELGATIQLGLLEQGLIPGGSGLEAPLGDAAPNPANGSTMSAATTRSTGEPPLRVYVVVVDGLRPQEVGPLTPTLNSLRAQGTWYEEPRAILPGETLPNHAAMMTGVLPRQNGIVANQIWRGRDYPDKEYLQLPEFLEADTLTTRLERAYRGDLGTATVLSKDYLFGLFRGEHPGPGDPLPQREADFNWDPRNGWPLYITDPSNHAMDPATMDAFLSWVRLQDAQGSSRPQFAMVNLGDVDRAGHADASGVALAGEVDPDGPLGPADISPFRQAALENTDTQIGSLVDELEQSGAWEETVLIVLSDHGMDWGRPDQAVQISNNAGPLGIAAQGYVESANPAVGDFWRVGGGGSELVYVHRERDIAPIAEFLVEQVEGVDYVATEERVPAIEDPKENPTLAELGVDHPRSPEIEVFLEPGWRSSPSNGTPNPLPGNHGHSVTQHSALMVAGGHPVLRDRAATVPGDEVHDPAARPFADPAGGPGSLSIAPTVAALFGVGEPPGGYDVSPLAEAFDPGTFDSHGGGPIESPLTAPRLPGPLATTLSADRRGIRYGEAFTLSGRVAAAPECGGPLRIALHKLAAGARSRVEVIATSIPVGADGAWSQRLGSRPTAVYRAAVQPTEQCAGGQSEPVSIPVHARVKLRRPCRGGTEIGGKVLPRAPRTRVLLQRFRRGTFRRVDSRRLDSASRFDFEPRSCRGRYRVVWPSQGGRNAPGAATFRAKSSRGGRL